MGKIGRIDEVIIHIDGRNETWSRNEAIDFYMDQLRCTRDDERKKNSKILAQLRAGLKYCTDDST